MSYGVGHHGLAALLLQPKRTQPPSVEGWYFIDEATAAAYARDLADYRKVGAAPAVLAWLLEYRGGSADPALVRKSKDGCGG